MSDVVERKYVMTKVEAGDYLLPSNDGSTLWRIRRYTDGPSGGLDPEVFPRDFERWSIYRWRGRIYPGSFADVEDWDSWEGVEDGLVTRRAAIDAALSR